MHRSELISSRQGVSVLEVMFAMVVALVGLVGIASLLPLAGRNARESIVLAEGQALANSWFDDMLVRGINNRNNYYFYQDFLNPPLGIGTTAFSNLPTRRNPYSTSVRVLNRQPVCIDPYFMSSRDIGPVFSNYNLPNNQPNHWYRPSMFPYFLDSFDPIVDPAFPYNSTYALPVDQPRMPRVTLGASGSVLSSRAAKELFNSLDDLVVDMDVDDSKPDATVPPLRYSAVNNSNNAKFSSKGNYSWMATICPTDTLIDSTPVDFALLSLIVFHNRDMVFFIPSARSGDPDVESKPQGERMFRVEPQRDNANLPVPFKGGFGGAVTLIAPDGVKPSLHAGDWIMLAKNRSATQAIFRWYRIVAIDEKAVFGPVGGFINGANGPNEVWGRQVTLDGPDWVFDANPTMATYMPNVVSVYERIVPY